MTTYTINQTNIFSDWFNDLKDPIGKAGIAIRIKRAESGNFGDCGYYLVQAVFMKCEYLRAMAIEYITPSKGETIYLLLMGGAKDSQQTDINKTVKLWQTIQQQDTQDNDSN